MAGLPVNNFTGLVNRQTKKLRQDHEFRTLLNFRDIGGATVQGGRQVSGGVLHSLADPGKISASDIQKPDATLKL